MTPGFCSLGLGSKVRGSVLAPEISDGEAWNVRDTNARALQCWHAHGDRLQSRSRKCRCALVVSRLIVRRETIGELSSLALIVAPGRGSWTTLWTERRATSLRSTSSRLANTSTSDPFTTCASCRPGGLVVGIATRSGVCARRLQRPWR